ncbi:MAG: hypothetical protein RIK87_13835 [Fuerstiella sp.]
MVFLLRRLFQTITGLRPGPEQLLLSFQQHRQELQENCIEMASAAGKPRGLKWTQSEWLDSFAVVRNPVDDMVTLFQGVNLSFEAIEGGEMEGVEAVSMVRDATAVFHFQNHRWGTGGRVLFNMTPEMAAEIVTPGQQRLLPRS